MQDGTRDHVVGEANSRSPYGDRVAAIRASNNVLREVASNRTPRQPIPGDTGSDRHAPAVWATGSAVGILLAVIVPLLLVDWRNNGATPLNILLVLVIVTFSAWRLTVSIAAGRADLLRSFFYVFVFVFFGISALAQTVTGVFPQDARTYSSETITAALISVILGIVAYEVGWHLYKRDGSGNYRGTVRGRWTFSPTRTALLGCFGVIASGYQVLQFGVGTFFTSRQETTNVLAGLGSGSSDQFYRVDDKAIGALTVFVTQYPIFISLFVILYSRRHGLWPSSSPYGSLLWRILICLLITANIVINNPIGNGRYWLGLLLAAFASIYFTYQRRGVSKAFIIGALLFFFFAFTALDTFRNTERSSFDLTAPQEALTQNVSYAMFQTDLNAHVYVDGSGYSFGNQILGAVLMFVPRSLWLDKPIATGQLVDSLYVRSSTAWGEMHVDFGAFGIVGFFLLYGLVSAAITARARLASPGLMHAVLPIAATFQFLLLRGSLQPVLGVLYELILVFALVLVRRPLRGLRSPPPRTSVQRSGI